MSMSYQALYRVWRPQQFMDVVGQEHITTTLQNALVQQKTSHAYLFNGPRGTGKTSAAKIFAKAVNCEMGPASEPCNECDSCRGITEGKIQDVIEIDAASNNGVDEIRELRDKVRFAPSSVKYKVYIIDEVHMLSTGAFNALLKTLEEPPKHAVFILATTEPHKIPLTIISRCQRFDFKRITNQAIVNRMKLIVDEIDVSVDDTALQIIARAAEGGMRDALSLLDQAISFSADEVTIEDVLTVTGSVSQGFLTRLAKAVQDKDVSSGLRVLDELLSNGKDPSRFIEEFILFYRDLLFYKTAPDLEETMERLIDDEFRSIAENVQSAEIYPLIELLNKTQNEMRWTNHPSIFLEVAVVKLCQLETAHDLTGQISQLVSKIEQLEQDMERLKSTEPKVIVKEVPVKQEKDAPSPEVPKKKPSKEDIIANEVLTKATKDALNLVRSNWGEMVDRLIRSHSALLTEAEPVAASNSAFIIKFNHEGHCVMANSNTHFAESVTFALQELTGKKFMVFGVTEKQWLTIRSNFLKVK